jgi:hypothetical protein
MMKCRRWTSFAKIPYFKAKSKVSTIGLARQVNQIDRLERKEIIFPFLPPAGSPGRSERLTG